MREHIKLQAPYTVTIIIPTYNRQESLQRTLDSLSRQTLPANRYEVIVVDDASTDGSQAVANNQYPFTLNYLRQKQNQGATKARNQGAQKSQGDILVFMDDDIELFPQTLQILTAECVGETLLIVLGTLITPDKIKTTLLACDNSNLSSSKCQVQGDKFVSFTECKTGLLAINRNDFFNLGMFQDPTKGQGWPNWDDVDFGYRAHLRGFRFLQCAEAIGEHWDYSLTSFEVAFRRWQRASKSAVYLFQVHPGLQPHIPMFYDKTPINWQEDPPKLVVRKIARQIASSSPVLGSLEWLLNYLQHNYPSSTLVTPLHRWIGGGYMFRGYREGLQSVG